MKYRVILEVNERNTTVESLTNFSAEDIPRVAMKIWNDILNDVLKEDAGISRSDVEIVSAELLDGGLT